MTTAEQQLCAVEHACPVCGVKPGKRCVTRRQTVNAPGYPPPRNIAMARKYPHSERIASAEIERHAVRVDAERKLKQLRAVERELLPDADDAMVQSELTVIRSEIRAAEQALHEQDVAA